MKERPILFSTPMVEAIIAGRKTQTRRVVKNIDHLSMKPRGNEYENIWSFGPSCTTSSNPSGGRTRSGMLLPCPYGKPGDRLWVRETFAINYALGDPEIVYKSDYAVQSLDKDMKLVGDVSYLELNYRPSHGWKPSIFMPRKYSRITLEIVGVRVERLQDISEADAKAEGVHKEMFEFNEAYIDYNKERFGAPMPSAHASFRSLWESINGAPSWNKNPWVWVVGFKRVATECPDCGDASHDGVVCAACQEWGV